jgi:23S rRNA (cytidine2498-2'-O)-methyltransferase
MTPFVGTANPGFAPYAMEELRRRFPNVSLRGLAAGETFLFAAPDRSEAEVAALLRKDEPIFLRHLFPAESETPLGAAGEEAGPALTAFASRCIDRVRGRKIAVQVRKSPDSPFPFSSAEARDLVASCLREAGAELVPRGADAILSVYAAGRTLYAGLSSPRDNLSDWPGGAVRFRREEGLVSRAAFKLLEAELTFRLPFVRFTHALDLGAAPGGWTKVLLERGVKVTAVDPAEMDPSLAGHPLLKHVRRNADELAFPPGSFDLLLCDMSWDPHRTCRIVSRLAPAMTAGASGIITLKLMGRKPMKTIAELTEAYAEVFEIRRVKQLFHNREEVTLWVKRKP